MIWVLLNIVATALNVGLYAADTDRWWNAAGATICGLCAVFTIAMETRR